MDRGQAVDRERRRRRGGAAPPGALERHAFKMRIHSYLELPWAIPEAEAAPFEEAMVDNELLRA